MDIKQQIKTLIQEAELYRTQGLLNESKGKYVKLASIIEANPKIKNQKTLLAGISNKIKMVESEIDRLSQAPSIVEVPEKIQDLIKKQFAFAAQDEDSAAIEGAIALAKFGQFDRALKEFKSLLEKDTIRVVAAKNIVRCYLSHTSVDDAINAYESWVSSGKFNPTELNSVRTFLEDILVKKGVEKTLTQVLDEEPIVSTAKRPEPQAEELQEDEYLDISAIKITFESGPQKGRAIEFDVNFQSGNILSLIISNKEKSILENLDVGVKLSNIEFFSPIAIFEGTGVVAEKTQIGTGPKRGDYSLDIKIVSTN